MTTTATTTTMHSPSLRVRKLHRAATVPAYQSKDAAGLDLAACLPDGPLTIEPGAIVRVPTGLSMAIPRGYEGQVRPRSGLAVKQAVTVPNTPGTIDADYRGELIVALINLGSAPFVVEHGLRVAQLVIAPVAQATILEVAELDDTDRGTGGFGSTGLH